MLNESLITEYEFFLPKGLVDEHQTVHRQGMMRLATARDELYVQNDRRVKQNASYASLVMLSRVILQLGNLPEVTPEMLEDLFMLDIAYLREFYNQINQTGAATIPVQCPQCAHSFGVELTLAGE